MSMIHYGNGKVIQIRMESGNVSRSISSENYGNGKFTWIRTEMGNVSRSITFGNFQF